MKALEYAKTRTLPSDLLAGVFAFARSNGRDQFRADDSDLQEIFASMEAPLVRKFFVFSTDGPIPFSPALDDAMSKLQLAGLIGRINPGYDEVVIKATAQDYLAQVLPKLMTQDEIDQLKEIAAVFVAQLERKQALPST